MKQQTALWESSNRPLFVKSVWIESVDCRHRHFILDYDNQRNLQDYSNKSKKALRSTTSFELAETQSLSLQLIGSSKACNPLEPQKLSIRRRSQTPSSPQKAFLDLLEKKIQPTKEEALSKRSSLQDIHNETQSCDDKLAERVLNWLDLAGKTTIIRPTNVIPVNPPPKKSSPVQRDKSSARSVATATKRPDSVKQVTIIFNKEGIPVRYNRPIRLSDLFRSSYNASKKLASSISTMHGRMVGNTEPGTSQSPGTVVFDRATSELNKSRSKSLTFRRTSHDIDSRSQINKQIIDESCNIREIKKQLHIFMPSLPKKTLVPNDCDSSCLSTGFSDYCKI